MKHKIKKESEILAEVCLYLKENGYFFWRSNNIPVFGKNNAGKMTFRAMPKFSMKGVPDIIMVFNGEFVGIEVKRPKQELSQSQVEFMQKTIENNAIYFVVHSREDLISHLTHEKLFGHIVV